MKQSVDAILVFPSIETNNSSSWPTAQYPTGLYKIASHCLPAYNVCVLDDRLINVVPAIEKLLRDNPKCLCIGFSVMTGSQITRALKLTDHFADSTIVWGGVHPSILPHEVHDNQSIDYVIVGEGENSFLELLNYISGKCSDLKNGSIVTKSLTPYSYGIFESFENSPYIDFNAFPINEKYFISRDGFKRAFGIETSRGCPYRCKYCHNSLRPSGYRQIEVSIIKDVIDYLIKVEKIDGIIFQEDNFFVNKQRVEKILNILSPFDSVGWKANSRIDFFLKHITDTNFMRSIENTNCSTLQFGVESGSERMLRFIDKKIVKKDIIKFNQKMSQFDINLRYNFIVGFPTETENELQQTLELIDVLQKDNSNVEPPFLNIYTPYPGTLLYETALREGFVPPKSTLDWADVDWNNFIIPWISERQRNYIEKISLQYRTNSRYLKPVD